MNMISKVIGSDATDEEQQRPDENQSNLRRYGIIAGIILAVFAGYFLLRGGAPAVGAPPAPILTVATPLQRDVMEWDDYVGRFEPSKTIEVRPRVSGQLVGVHFTDGAIVRKGQLLFTIDARPFSAALAEAQAEAASARSDLSLAQSNLARANRLIADDAVSQSDIDQLHAKARAANAALAAAQARIRARALDVQFTHIRAPISGRISDRRIDAGSQVSSGGEGAGTLLTTINALDPIYFSFTGSEALFLKAMRAQQSGSIASPVEIKLQDEADYKWQGKLDFTDNGIDAQSGTIRNRAVLANSDMFLTPGMFGDMRLSTGEAVHVLLVPDAAVQTDQARKTVFVVDRTGTVATRQVEIGPVVNGLRVIRSGLLVTDKVVIIGLQFAQPGAKAKVKQVRIVPDASQAPKATPSQTVGQATLLP